MPLCQLLDEVSSAGAKGARTVRTRARTAYQLWSKEFFKDEIVDDFEEYFKKLDKPDTKRAGYRTKWTKEYFNALPSDVRAHFEAEALVEKVQQKKEATRLKAEDPATKLGEDQCPDNGGDEKGGAGKVK